MGKVLPFQRSPSRRGSDAPPPGAPEPRRARKPAASPATRADWFLFAQDGELTDLVCAVGDLTMRALLEQEMESMEFVRRRVARRT